MNKNIGLLILASVIAFTTPTMAFETSGAVVLTSNYISRGVSQTDNDPALQGDIGASFDNGFYLGVWGSNVNFGMSDPSHVEFDPYIGYSNDFNDDWSYDISLFYYLYPSAIGGNYAEAQLFLNYKIFTFGYAYTNNNWNTETQGHYITLGAEESLHSLVHYDLFKDLRIGGHFGYVLQDDSDPVFMDIDDYFDYKIYLSKECHGLSFEIGFASTIGSNIDDKTGKDNFYASVSKSI